MNPFEILGLSDDAAPQAVKARYYELAQVHHPDHGGDTAKFEEICVAYKEAYRIASEPKTCCRCQGRGKIKVWQGFNSIDWPCDDCGGKGKIDG